jgi:UDP-N-acetylglucosamine 2-epimerase (non-hydrolysing)
VGTRPEAIKLAPVAEALNARGVPLSLIFTGQHPQLDPADFGLNRFSPIRLNCPGRKDPHAHVGAVTKQILPLLGGAGLLIVQGDTSSALGGALAAAMAGIPLGHVEAGLRSHDRSRPWPEEEFRIAIDSKAELLFAPTELSVSNLRRERVRGRIHVTGNSGIDAALRTLPSITARPRNRSRPRLLVTCHRRESWGEGFASIASALRRLAQDGSARIDLILHPNPAVAAQMRLLLGNQDGIQLGDPCSHGALMRAMLESDLVLSDSGGIQEEAAAFGVPLLVLRERTERPEAIATGHFLLAGIDSDRIIEAVRRMLSRNQSPAHACPYGDGRAGARIAMIVDEWRAERRFHTLADVEPDYAPFPTAKAKRRVAT